MHVQFNVFAQQSAQHVIHACHYGVQVDDTQFQDLLAAECEQLAGKRGGAFACPADLQQVRMDGILIGEVFENKIAVAINGSEQVVEVMSNATGQLSHRFQLLRMAQLFLKRAQVCNVLLGSHHAYSPAVVVGDDFGLLLNQPHLSVRKEDAVLNAVRFAQPSGFAGSAEHSIASSG